MIKKSLYEETESAEVEETGLQAIEVIDNAVYDTKFAANYCGYKPGTFRNARSRGGKLAGVAPPKPIKMGRSIKYLGKTLKAWRAQFEEDSLGGEAS